MKFKMGKRKRKKREHDEAGRGKVALESFAIPDNNKSGGECKAKKI